MEINQSPEACLVVNLMGQTHRASKHIDTPTVDLGRIRGHGLVPHDLLQDPRRQRHGGQLSLADQRCVTGKARRFWKVSRGGKNRGRGEGGEYQALELSSSRLQLGAGADINEDGGRPKKDGPQMPGLGTQYSRSRREPWVAASGPFCSDTAPPRYQAWEFTRVKGGVAVTPRPDGT